MAKKVVATLKKKDAEGRFVKLVRAIKNPETGAYSFKEEIVPESVAKEAMAK